MTNTPERVHGLHVLRLAGTDYEMGYQHGEALREAIPRGPIPAFAKYVQRVLVGTLGGVGVPVAKGIGLALAETVGRSIAKQFPASTRQGLDGLADGARIPRAELLRAVTMPETYLWLASQWIGRGGHAMAPRLDVPLFGCTSAIARASATKDKRLLHGRNFDYQGVGTWDREQAVVFHRPKEGQHYVAVSAAGILFGGITAMNASGLSLVVHQHLHSTDFDLGGVPIGVVGDEVMRYARTLDDAKKILDDHIPNGSWTYVVCSAKEDAVLCYEVTAKRRALVPVENDVFGYSNLFLASSMKDRELHAYPSHWRNVTGRYHLTNRRLEQMRGTIDEHSIASVLADPGCTPCRFQDAIACLQTVASVVFDPTRGIVWVATGRAPVSTNEYVAFELEGERARPDLGTLHPGAAIPKDARAAFEAYRDAYEAAFAAGDYVTARRHVEIARRAQPDQPIYHFVAGLLSLRRDEATDAVRCFDRALACGHPSRERVATFHLWRGRARDLRGARAPAIDDYERARFGDPHVRAAANKGLSKPWKRTNVAIEWSFGDCLGA